MANWSKEDVYVGRVGMNVFDLMYEVLSNWSFEPGEGKDFLLERLDVVGTCVRLSGIGRWGARMPLNDRFTTWMHKGVVVCEYVSADHDYIDRSVFVGGREIYARTFEHTMSEPVAPWAPNINDQEISGLLHPLFTRLNTPQEQSALIGNFKSQRPRDAEIGRWV